MTFWSSNLESKRKFRFVVMLSDGVSFDVKSVTIPSFEVNQGEYQLANHKFKYPGLLTWNDITITYVDTKSQVNDLLQILKRSGWGTPSSGDKGISKTTQSTNWGFLSIQTLDQDGKPIDEWKLHGGWLKAVDFGELSYDSDDLVEFKATIAYDWAEHTQTSSTAQPTPPPATSEQ